MRNVWRAALHGLIAGVLTVAVPVCSIATAPDSHHGDVVGGNGLAAFLWLAVLAPVGAGVALLGGLAAYAGLRFQGPRWWVPVATTLVLGLALPIFLLASGLGAQAQ